jgi:hypothetical protein
METGMRLGKGKGKGKGTGWGDGNKGSGGMGCARRAEGTYLVNHFVLLG